MKYLKYAFLGLFSLGFLGAIAGVMVIAAIINHYGHDLPDYQQLKDYEPPIVSRLYAGDGKLMAEFAQEKRVFMPIEAIPPLVKNAFLAAEDKNFYTHEGVDPSAIARAAVIYLRHMAGQDVSVVGGSTITQQVVKNFLLTNERSFERKIREAILASRMEKALSKDRILELYLNEIYLGYRAYGVAAAALQYFDKSLDELTIAEAAYLAALPKAPNNYHPIKKKGEAVARRNWVIDRMVEDGHISKGQADLAKLQPLEIVKPDLSRRASAAFFAEEVRRELITRYGDESLYGGGLAVRSSLDPQLQSLAVTSLRSGLMAYDRRHGWRGPVQTLEDLSSWRDKLNAINPPDAILDEWELAVVLESGASQAKLGFKEEGKTGVIKLEQAKWARKSLNEGYAQGPEINAVNEVLHPGDVVMVEPTTEDPNSYYLRQIPRLQGALIAIDPHTGRVLAMQGGWKYGISEFNRATQAKRQPGSAFKPFVYLAALEKGFTPSTKVLDAPFVMEDRPGHYWSPTNYTDEFLGPTTLRVGIEKSKNLMTVRLANHLGMDFIAGYAERLGIFDSMPRMLSYSLGAGETTLIRLTAAYGMLVNGGKRVTPTLIDRIQDRRGNTIFQHDQRPCLNCGPKMKWVAQETPVIPDEREQLVDSRVAYQMVSILEGVVQRGTAVRIKELGRPLAGKTGTTNESKDAWFIGFSPDLVVGVYTGFDDPHSMGKRETGSSVAVPIFKAFMGEALKDEPLTPFRIPPGIKQVAINARTGALASPGDDNVIWEAFLSGTEPDNQFVIDSGGGYRGSSSSSSSSSQEDTGSSGNGGSGREPITGTGGLY